MSMDNKASTLVDFDLASGLSTSKKPLLTKISSS